MVKVKIDMTGWVMSEHGVPDSRLTVLEQAEDWVAPNGKHIACWLCECNCKDHNKIIVRGGNIRNGNTKSCGCLSSETTVKYNQTVKKKYNDYIINGEVVIGYTSNTNQEYYVDLKNFDKIKDYCWRECVSPTGLHRLVFTDSTTKKPVSMHTILGFKHHDHIDHNELNNLESNLRPATTQQNGMNKKIGSRNTSGVIGVSWKSQHNKWQAAICYQYKSIYLGIYVDKNDAIKARLEAEAKYFGKFAPQAHLFEQYGIEVNNND